MTCSISTRSRPTRSSVVTTLKKFGLLEPSEDRLVPTQRALEIYNLTESDPRRIQELKDAALSPPIYRELIEQHRAVSRLTILCRGNLLPIKNLTAMQ
jgi:hypothetical protein